MDEYTLVEKSNPFKTANNTPSYIEEKLARAMNALELPYQAQYAIDNFTIDFAFPHCHLLIECDGYEYHHTKEQLAKDACRDRKLARFGWQVLRFTGSQIHADADLCALEIQAVVERRESRREQISRDVVTEFERAGCNAEIWVTPEGARIEPRQAA
jgi:very-short-patch-repair endonuclease